jgi:oligoendopeptidase F
MIFLPNFAAQAASATFDNNLGTLPEWNLNDLYPSFDSDELKNDLKASLEDAQNFESKHKGKLEEILKVEEAGDQFFDVLKTYEAMQDRIGRIGTFAYLFYVGNTSDPVRIKFLGDTQDALTKAFGFLMFFELEINRIDDKLLDGAISESTKLSHYQPWLKDLRLDRPHQLDDKIEKLFLEKHATSANAFNRLFDETMASLKFKVDGAKLSIEPTLNLLQDQDAEKRKKASEALSKTFGKNIALFTLITNTLAKDKEISDRWRGFEDVADSRHLANRVERPVVDALVNAVQQSFPSLSHRYYKMKAGWFNRENLNTWDRNAPLPFSSKQSIAWEEARKIVLEAYHGFSPEIADIAKDFFDKNWIDAIVKPGKSPGAFSHPAVPSVHPYVMMNYQGKPRDVMTLAHELGHGVHQVLAAKQGALMANTPLTLAETASVFGEMLTFQSLLKQATSPLERKAMLAAKVEDMLNTVVRQIAFYMFERKVHEARRQGELTSEQLGQFWSEIQQESLGQAIKTHEGYENFWCYIPHFIHSPFYVYAYAFGDCLVNSLYAVYQDSNEGFQDKYLEMLSAGGTKHHSELLAPFGLDASEPSFWLKGLSVISSMIDELEKLNEKS